MPSGGVDPEEYLRAQRLLWAGMDLSKPDQMTEEEKEAYKEHFRRGTGRPHYGLNFWLDAKPDILKRYRAWANWINHNDMSIAYNPNGFGFVYLYGITGFADGVRYITFIEQRHGLTKEEILEGIGLAFIYLGPRGIETVATGLEGFEWKEPGKRPPFPENWAPDPKAFHSGIDFSSSQLTPEEFKRIVDWYERVEGEVPGYVHFLGEYRPQLLKRFRDRFENTIRKLPKQVMPYVMIHINVMRGFREGIRESVLLAKGFGMTKAQTVEAISWGMFYGGVESGSIVHAAAGDVLKNW